jgi:hypothetical protein
VKAQPGARRTAVTGLHGGALKVAVQAPPEKGKANEALLRFLEEALGLTRGALGIASGEGSRDKRFLARGTDAASLAARLGGLVPGHGHGHGHGAQSAAGAT